MTVKESLSNKTPNSKCMEYENKDYYRGYREGYTIGAEKQQEIDIQKACEVFTEFVRHYFSMISPEKRKGRDIKYEIEMFKQAMKGK